MIRQIFRHDLGSVMARITLHFSQIADGDVLAAIGDTLRQRYEAGDQVIALVAALEGVEDLLQQSIALGSYLSVYNKLQSIHSNVARRLVREPQDRSLLLQDLDDMLDSYRWLGNALVNRSPTAAETATILGLGERLCARLLSAYLQFQGLNCLLLNPQELIVTNEEYDAATIYAAQTQNQCAHRLTPQLKGQVIAVMGTCGGGTSEGQVTRLIPANCYRAACLIAATTDCSGLWFMGQRDGLLMADPDLLRSPATVPVLPVRLLDDLVAYGLSTPSAQVLTSAVAAQVPIYLRNLNNPDHPGSYVHPDNEVDAPVVLASQHRMHHLAVEANYEREDILRVLRTRRLTILDVEQGFLIPAAQLNSARDMLRDLLPGAKFVISDDSGALITLIGADLDLESLVQHRLERAGIGPLRLLKTSGVPGRWHLSALIRLEQIEMAVECLYTMLRD